MTFLQLIKNIEKRIKYEGPEIRYRIKNFINDAILEFMSIRNWQELIEVAALITDGSDSYTIASIIGDDYYYGPIDLIRDGKNDTLNTFRRVKYQYYLRANEKAGLWAIHNDTIYYGGNGEELSFFYLTPGELYPLEDDNDTNIVLNKYVDIIEQYAIVKFHIWEGDNESASYENSVLNNKITLRKKKEFRDDKGGKLSKVGYGNR